MIEVAEVEDRLEVDRVRNLITGFGWVVGEEKLTEDEIQLQIKKRRTVTKTETPPVPG